MMDRDMRMMMQELKLKDHVEMRKPHPCGSLEWEVYRIGADIGLRCLGCDRRVLLSRTVFAKRLKKILNTGENNL